MSDDKSYGTTFSFLRNKIKRLGTAVHDKNSTQTFDMQSDRNKRRDTLKFWKRTTNHSNHAKIDVHVF